MIADPSVTVSMGKVRSTTAVAPPIDPTVLDPAEKLAAEFWPGVPLVRTLLAGATDGGFLTPAGIPTYGVSGMFADPDGAGVHGLNERIRVKSLYEGRDYLYRLLKIYGDLPG